MQDPERLSETCFGGDVTDGNFRTARIEGTVRLDTGVS